SRVHAEALAGGLRAVGEDVAEVAVAPSAAGLGADHPVARVGVQGDPVRRDRLPEARPARPRVVLGVGAEQLEVAHDTAVDAGFLGVPVGAGEGPFGAGPACDLELLGGEPLTQLVLVDLDGGDVDVVAHAPIVPPDGPAATCPRESRLDP